MRFGIFLLVIAWFQALWAVLVVASEVRWVSLAGLLVNAPSS
jgi:hypothetical protein